MGRLDDLLTLEAAGQLPDELQADLTLLRQAGALEQPAPETSWLQEGAATAVEVGGAVLGGVTGAALGAPTGPGAVVSGAAGAAAGGALARPVADYIRGKPTTVAGVASSALTSAIPGGVAAKVGGGIARRGLAHALEGAVIGEVSTEARTRIEEGRAPTTEERLIGAGGGAVVGGAVGGVAARLSRKPASPVGDTPIVSPLEDAATTLGREQGATTPTEAVQLGLFDAEGHVRPQVADLTVEGASVPATAEMTDAVKAEGVQAAKILASTDAAAENQRLYLQVAEAFEKGEIDAPGLIKELSVSGRSMSDFVQTYYKPTIARAGRQLQQLSTLRRQLEASKDPAMKDVLDALSTVKTSNQFVEFLQKLDDTRRALLVSQVKTGVRNAFSQGIAYGTDLIEQAASQAVGGEGNFFGSIESAMRAFHRKESRAAVESLLKGRRDLIEKIGEFEYRPPNTYLSSPLLRPTLGRFVEATTWINRAQEEFYRRAKFDAVVRNGVKKAGLKFDDVVADPKLMPEGLLDKAVDQSLDLTFANTNPGGLEKWVAGAQSLRPISTVLAPFPRYMANAVTYIAKRNPLGLIRLATAAGREKSDEVVREAFSGTLLLGGAIAARYNAGGEKWYEIAVGDKRLDTRGVLGPFGAYMFMGDAVKRYLDTGELRYTPEEYVEGVLSMSRVAGTLQQLATFLKSKADDPRSSMAKFQGIIGEWVSGFATPAKNVRDAFILAGSDEEAIQRDSRNENPLLGPILRTFPGASQALPERPKLTTGAAITTESPVASGLLGLNIRSTDAVEREINRLSIPLGDLAPKTGIPKADRELTRRIGKAVSTLGPKLLKAPGYQRLSEGEKVIVLKQMFEKARAAARDNLAETSPDLAAAVKLSDQLTGDQRRVLQERGVDVGARIQQMVERAPEKSTQNPPAPATPAPEASKPESAESIQKPSPIVSKGRITTDAIEGVATLVGLPPALLSAVLTKESSGGKVNALAPETPYSGGERATGPMQLLPSTFREWADQVSAITGKAADVNDPLDNLLAGALMYRRLIEEHGDVATAARFYHGGPDTSIHGPKTRAYGNAVAALYSRGA